MTLPSTSQVVRLVVVMAIVLGGSFALARSLNQPAQTTTPPGASAPPGHDHDSHDHGSGSNGQRVVGDGRLQIAEGYHLLPAPVSAGQLSFRILNVTGQAETDFALTHTKPLHMFVFRTDLTDFHHVHPALDESGVWTLDLPPLTPGRHRVVAEFDVTDDDAPSIMLGTWMANGRQPAARPLPEPVTSLQVDDYTVTLDGDLSTDVASQFQVAIADGDGAAVELEPYLGSWAHAVLISADTHAVTHLHPGEAYASDKASPESLHLDVPPGESGTYRLFVEFATATGLHRAEFTVLRQQ